jgi:hypothetical protein
LNWKTAVDPVSGRTYFYDTITRKTQWEKVRCVRFQGLNACFICWKAFGVWCGMLEDYRVVAMKLGFHVRSLRTLTEFFFLTHCFFSLPLSCYALIIAL